MILKNTIVAMIVACVTSFGLTSLTANSAEVTIKGASCFPIGSPPSKPFEGAVKAINAAGKGIIQIKLIGGAPAIGSPFTLVKNMSKGIYDIAGCPDAYYGNVVPEAKAHKLTEFSAAEMRKNGAYAYYNTILAKKKSEIIRRVHEFWAIFSLEQCRDQKGRSFWFTPSGFAGLYAIF